MKKHFIVLASLLFCFSSYAEMNLGKVSKMIKKERKNLRKDKCNISIRYKRDSSGFSEEIMMRARKGRDRINFSFGLESEILPIFPNGVSLVEEKGFMGTARNPEVVLTKLNLIPGKSLTVEQTLYYNPEVSKKKTEVKKITCKL